MSTQIQHLAQRYFIKANAGCAVLLLVYFQYCSPSPQALKRTCEACGVFAKLDVSSVMNKFSCSIICAVYYGHLFNLRLDFDTKDSSCNSG